MGVIGTWGGGGLGNSGFRDGALGVIGVEGPMKGRGSC